MRPSQTILVLEKLRKSFSAPLYRQGVELSLDDSQTTLDVYQQWLLLMVDLDYLHPESLERSARRLWIDLIQADVLDLNNAFAECLHLVRVQSNKGFKGLCKKISSHLYPMVKDDMDRVLLGDVFSARRLVQLFSYTGRLSLNDIDLTQQMLDDYMKTEEGIPSEFPDHLIRRLNKVIRRWMTPFVPAELQFGHGPGGVAGHGRVSLEYKYKDLTSDQRLKYAFGNVDWVDQPIPSTLDRISQTIFVAKSYKTFRTISMEPTTLQYLQQGVWKAIDSQVNSSRYLRNRIGFHEQERNQILAEAGSIDRDFATIDLSAASDSVGYELVKKLFRGTWLLRYVVALRSTHSLLPDGRLVELKKFAPMGSALCFPIETIIFASICEVVTRKHRVNGGYSVFGDDIIVPTQCVDDVMQILETLGFRVNRDKSFYDPDCWFRESCGGEYCDGFDVTPMRVSRNYASREQLVRQAKLIELSNTAYKRGFKNLRIFFLKKLVTVGYTPLFSPTEVLADNYTNYHTRRRWKFDLQRIEAEVTSLGAEYRKKDLLKQDEHIRYRHWLESTAGRISLGDGFQSVICKPTVITKNTWRTKPYELLDQQYIDYCREVEETNRPL